MRDYEGLKHNGGGYKGNLHSHTTISDGLLQPEEAVQVYREHGYQFLALSEHDIFTDFRDQFNTEDFIMIPAVESSAILYQGAHGGNRLKIHHLHGILGTSEMQQQTKAPLFRHMEYIPPRKYFGNWPGREVSQEIADMLRDHGCVVTYNHPIWSRITEEEFIHTDGVQALEIFNYNTVLESNTGYDVTYWDRMLRMGKHINGFASDDNHNEGLFEDCCGGWICVQAPELTHDAIVQNFIDGNYYSSAGPMIRDWGIRDGIAWIDCSPVNRIHFVAGNVINDGTTVLGEAFEDSLEHGEYRMKGHETYLRAEVTDKYGRTAWTNPIYLDSDEA